MNKAIAVAMLGVLGLILESGVAGADDYDRAEIATGVASCVNAAMSQGRRSEAFSVAYCQCVVPQIVRAMPTELKKAGTKEQGEHFTVNWVEQNPVALGACLKSAEVADKKS